ncbi:tetratricopeptide repeat protein [Sphaerotilus sp.]|jgi:predicted negative regulator of RcsB-dependent stress response|uniref:YfgM family protein n=1 Tax=Sphaerotilus sp. TaxID=2093942 RepID=UPI00286E842A|nr:tetratricopeptide repeat protein [Sphaerotilus sp.]
MASHLDLEEQEQLDQIKHFWAKFGNLITWVLLIVLTAYAGWNGWQYWQRDQAAKAGGIYDELDRSAQAGDAERVTKVWADLQSRYPSTAFAEQGGLLAAKVQFDKGQADAARGTLEWVALNAKEDEYRALARLRLAGVHLEARRFDEALKLVTSEVPESLTALAADRRGDILQAQAKPAEAVAAYQQAWKALGKEVDYRRLVEAKLVALGAAPQEEGAASGAAQ